MPSRSGGAPHCEINHCMLALLLHEHVVQFGLRPSTAHDLDMRPLPRMHRDVHDSSLQADVRSTG